MKQMAVVVLLLAATLLMVQPVAAGQGSPDAPVNLRITASALRGNPGDSVTVTGSGAVPGQSVFVSLSPQADSAAGAFITQEVIPAASGTFSVGLTIPANVPDGVYALRAEQFSPTGAVLQFYWNAFTVGAGGTGGPLLPISGGEANSGLARVYIIFGLVILAMMLSQGLYSAGKGILIEVEGNRKG